MQVSPSILTCDFSRLQEAVTAADNAGADRLHLDVMDGVFVPNITFGAPVIRCLRPLTDLPFDTHLMIKTPERLIDDFIAAGSDIITIHAECDAPLGELLTYIREQGRQTGLSLNPDTPVERVLPFLPMVDQILVMTVQPGFGGQALREDVLPKIARLREEIDRQGRNITIEVDGGINRSNAPRLAKLGVDTVVIGSAFFADESPAELTRFIHSL